MWYIFWPREVIHLHRRRRRTMEIISKSRRSPLTRSLAASLYERAFAVQLAPKTRYTFNILMTFLFLYSPGLSRY